MPEPQDPKTHPHPGRTARSHPRRAPAPGPPYAELHARSNFTFLHGASHPEELVERAAELGYHALAVTDECSLAGIVRAHVAAKGAGLPLLVGSEIRLEEDGLRLVLLVSDAAAYARLSRLVTRGRRRCEKGSYRLALADLDDLSQGLCVLAVPEAAALVPRASRAALDEEAGRLRRLRELFADRAWLAAALHEGPDDRDRLQRLEYLERASALPLVAAGDVDAHVARRRPLRDVLAAIRRTCTVAELGLALPAEGCHPMRTREELARLYAARPDLLARTIEVAGRCRFSLDELTYVYPDEAAGRSLRELALKGARGRWPQGVPAKVLELIEHELALIGELRYERYFLTVYDIVRFARSRGILCQGRGSAANSAVCYCLGITAIDPDRFDGLFERFISRDRNEPPDIDVDFEHERREEVLQYIYERYGRERAGMAATVITYRGRSAVRDVGKAMGLTLDQVDRLAKNIGHWGKADLTAERMRQTGLDPDDPTLRRVMVLVGEIQGFPRHLSQHVGGMVITQGRLDELVPIENAAMEDRTVIQWDKDDLDSLGILKVDCLGLGMLTAIHRTFDLVEATRGRRLDLASVPKESAAVYAMTHRADTIGAFQIESRAQMAMLPRFKPKEFYDLVIEVAIVRPGPIQGGMVHPYLRRRAGKEEVSYPSPEVASVLKKTLGVPIFQEQVMKLAVVAAGFTPGEADQLRRAMGAWRRPGIIDTFHEKLVSRMTSKGYTPAFAEALFRQIRGFGEYGFPESHAASFALLTYVSCWLKRFEPAAFTCALLNSLPMGFYAPAQLVADARNHGVEVRPVDVTRSEEESTLETDGLPPLRESPERPDLPPEEYGAGGPALRLGLRRIKGISGPAAARIVAARARRPFESVEDCVRRARLDKRHATLLAEAGAFRPLTENRRTAWWQAGARLDDAPLFRTCDLVEPAPELPEPGPVDLVFADYLRSGLSLEAHPVSLLRETFREKGYLSAAEIQETPDGAPALAAGLCICRQRPSTASGILFVTLEDETGFVNAIVRRNVQERFRVPLLRSNLLLLKGTIQNAEGVVHLMATEAADLSPMLADLPSGSRDFH